MDHGLVAARIPVAARILVRTLVAVAHTHRNPAERIPESDPDNASAGEETWSPHSGYSYSPRTGPEPVEIETKGIAGVPMDTVDVHL